MQGRYFSAARITLFTYLVANLVGCQHGRQQECAESGFRPAVQSIPCNASEVMIMGHATSTDHIAPLDVLVTELRDSLTAFGSLRVMVATPLVCGAECPAEVRLPLSGRDDSMLHDATDSGVSQANRSVEEAPVPSWMTDELRINVTITVDEYIPYRPMKLAATILVENTDTGQELAAFQGTWNGPGEGEPLADANHSLQRALKAPSPRVVTEAGNLASISPHRFLSSIAEELAPVIHDACLSANPQARSK
jgi:hypothetical protein